MNLEEQQQNPSNNHLTLEERHQIKKWLLRGYSCGKIAVILDRGKNTIVLEVRKNGGKENYDPVKAYEAHKHRMELGNEKKRKAAPLGANPYTNMSHRISNLEMQMEILFDEIRSLRSGH